MMTHPSEDTCGQAFLNGVVDRSEFGLTRKEQLYRSSVLHRALWALGWRIAHVLTSRPLRTESKMTWHGRRVAQPS